MTATASTLDLHIYGPSDHAQERMLERFGIELHRATWDTIITNARAGLYAEMPNRWPSISGAVHTYGVPMGTCETDMVIVPVVIDVDRGSVVTVLPE